MPTIISVSRAEVLDMREGEEGDPKVSQWKQRFRRAQIRFGDWQTSLHAHLCSQCRQELGKSP